ncbi:hypothetical protein JCM11251_000976 [Rhodosporidiobolus azoricus]
MLSRPTPSNTKQPKLSPLTPTYILRAHSAPVSVLHFTRDGRFLLSGDTDGFVAIWDLKTFRPLYFWRAHGTGGTSAVGEGQGVLGVEELGGMGGVLTQGRDNSLRLYRLPVTSAAPSTAGIAPATSVPSPSAPSNGLEQEWEMDINAMNFCRVGILRLSGMGERENSHEKGRNDKGLEDGSQGEEALVAVVSLTKDEFVDIFHYPSKARIHRSIGSGAFDVGEKTGSVMAAHLLQLPSTSPISLTPSAPSSSNHEASSSNSFAPSPTHAQTLHLLVTYESGHLVLFRFAPPPPSSSSSPASAAKFAPSANGTYDEPMKGKMVQEGEGWAVVWKEKGHKDAVMSLSIDSSKRFAYTVGADHFVCKYRVFDLNEEEALLPRILVEETTSPGKAAIAARGDGKLVAVGGWDGECRLYSAKTLTPLAVLSHHRSSLQAVAFSPLSPPITLDPRSSSFSSSAGDAPPFLPIEEDSDDSDTDEEATKPEGGKETKKRKVWLAAGGQEGKISLWEVYSPS